jgi:hypothetical protein
MVFAALPSFCDGEDEGNAGWIDVLAPRQTGMSEALCKQFPLGVVALFCFASSAR